MVARSEVLGFERAFLFFDDAIEARLRTGRPLATQEWIARQEAATGRLLRPAKPGPKRKEGVSHGR